MHVGFETTPVLGAKRNLGDTWTMLEVAIRWAHGRKSRQQCVENSADEWA